MRDVSRLFLWGFEGGGVSTRFGKVLAKYPPAGVILLKRNLESPHQIKLLTANLQQCSDSRLLIGIDEEGGRVRRLPEPFVAYPPMAKLGQLYQKTRDPVLLEKLGQYLAHELLDLGINLDFAPVLDVNSNPQNPIIGDRAFSNDPKIVAKAALAFYQGMKKAGLVTCGKHFPGHGDTSADSHLALPTVRRKKASLEKIELPPFQAAVRAGIPMLMTAHVVYDAWDPDHPATLSRKIIQDLLRKKMGYRGVVISDDLHMKAVADRYSLAESALLSLEAGVDIPLICRGGEEGAEVVAIVTREVKKSLFLKRQVLQSLSRLEQLKKRYNLK